MAGNVLRFYCYRHLLFTARNMSKPGWIYCGRYNRTVYCHL